MSAGTRQIGVGEFVAWPPPPTLSPPQFERRPAASRSGERERAIDLVHLARATDGDESLEAELLAMFDRQSAKLAARIKLVDLDRRAARRHRPSAARLGAGDRRLRGGPSRRSGRGGVRETSDEPTQALAALDAAVAAARAAIAELALVKAAPRRLESALPPRRAADYVVRRKAGWAGRSV